MATGRQLIRPLTPLIGRESEIADVVSLFDDHQTRLVTLTGPGGIGKTRLAQAAADSMLEAFSDDVRFVSLAPIADYRLVIPTVARALGIEERGDRKTLDQLIDQLQDRRVLLVLDNVEHVLGAAPEIVQLLIGCSSLCVMATGREPLNVQGEHLYPVQPLEVPAGTGGSLAASDAVELFVNRVQLVAPGFDLNDENAATVAEICRKLDGIPLALELAAARVKVLSPEDLLARLDRPMTVLTGGPRDAPARQQTMRDTLEWSYELLSPDEQRLFRQFSAFTGGCTLAAIEAIAVDGEIVDTLGALVDKSLVRRVDYPGHPARYGMLEPVRQFARELLECNTDEFIEARQRHADFFAASVENLHQRLDGPDGPALFEQIEAEHDNVRAVLRWLLESEQAEPGMQLIRDLGVFWIQRAYLGEGLDWTEAFLSLATTSPRSIERGRALWTMGWLLVQRDDPESLAVIEEALAIFEEHDRPCDLAHALFSRGSFHMRFGNDDHMRQDAERAMQLFRECDDAAMVGRVLVHLAQIELRAGRVSQSRAIVEEALGLARAGGHNMVLGLTLGMLGGIAVREDDDERAADLYRERLTTYRELGNPRGIAESFMMIAMLAHRHGKLEQAVCLLSAATDLQERTDSQWFDSSVHADPDEILRDLSCTLIDSIFEDAWNRGREMTNEEAIEFAMRTSAIHPEPARDRNTPAGLSPRELEILQLIVAGKSNREMAEVLFISSRTVERHVANVYRKIDAHNRAEATAWALKNDIV